MGSFESSLMPTTLAGSRIDPADSIDFREWVMVDVAKEKVRVKQADRQSDLQ